MEINVIVEREAKMDKVESQPGTKYILASTQPGAGMGVWTGIENISPFLRT